MKQLMGASVVGEVDKEVLYWTRQGFLLCRELEDAGYWKTEALSREQARHWCEVNGLTECDYMPVFGLWDLRERSSLGCCQ